MRSKTLTPSLLLQKMPPSKWLFVTLLSVFIITQPSVSSTPTHAQLFNRPDSFADLAERLSPSVVNISTTTVVEGGGGNILPFPPGSPFEEFFRDLPNRDRRRQAQALGSGFIISQDGVVVTNNHVIDEADEIRVTLANDRSFPATLLGRDPKTDIAVLKIDAGREQLQPVVFGDSDAMRVGDWVVAIGNPFGLGGSVTAGIVSARGRDIGTGPYDDFIQTDAAINRGNSGGPLFNLEGEVIGINTAIFSQTGGSVGVSFAIASNLASNVVMQLRDFGETRRGWLGVFIQQITPEIAEGFGLDSEKGALISSVHSGSPAEDAGLQAGDVVLSFDGKDIDAMRNLPRIVAESTIGEPLPMVVLRNGREMRLFVTLGVLEEAEESGLLANAPSTNNDNNDGGSSNTQDNRIDRLGIEIATITPILRRQYDLASDATGAVITGVNGDSSAASVGVRVGDIIVSVGRSRTNVATAEEAVAAINDEIDAGRSVVALLIRNANGDRFVAIPLADE